MTSLVPFQKQPHHARRPGQQDRRRHLPRRRSRGLPDRRRTTAAAGPRASRSTRRWPTASRPARRLKSIEASVYLKRNFIYSLFHSGPGQAIFPEDDPAKVFERLFSTGVPAPVTPANPSPTVNEDFGRLRARKKSILDRAMEEYRRLQDHRGRQRPDAPRPPHERHPRDRARPGGPVGRRQRAPPAPAASCRRCRPAAIDFQAHTKLHSELLTMALACDITRVASMQTRASLTSFTWLGVNNGQHAISHQQGSAGPDAQLNKIATWFTEQWAITVERPEELPGQSTAGRCSTTPCSSGPTTWAPGRTAASATPGCWPPASSRSRTARSLETGRYLKSPGGTALNQALLLDRPADGPEHQQLRPGRRKRPAARPGLRPATETFLKRGGHAPLAFLRPATEFFRIRPLKARCAC